MPSELTKNGVDSSYLGYESLFKIGWIKLNMLKKSHAKKYFFTQKYEVSWHKSVNVF